MHKFLKIVYRFGQAKIGYGGFVFKFVLISSTETAASKIILNLKVLKRDSKIIVYQYPWHTP